jgi:hypothetical protein
MRRLNRNYWRLGWVLVVNCIIIFLELAAPIHQYHNEKLMSETLRVAAPPIFVLEDPLC